VGGTRLLQNAGTWEGETVWNDGGEKEGKKTGAGASGGGCSAVFAAPLWQQALPAWSGVGCVRRAVADVSADADPYTGVDVYDSTATPSGNKGWTIIGGTSVASPIVASVFALAGGAHGVEYPARTLYENAAAITPHLHDVSVGSNGECKRPFGEGAGTSGCTTAEQASSCSARRICLAGAGYDGPSGVGTPAGTAAFQLPGHSTEGPAEAESTKATGSAGGGGGAGAAAAGASGQPVAGPSPTPVVSPAPPRATVASVSALALTSSTLFALERARLRISRAGHRDARQMDPLPSPRALEARRSAVWLHRRRRAPERSSRRPPGAGGRAVSAHAHARAGRERVDRLPHRLSRRDPLYRGTPRD
jgi:hypothetical protein